MPLMRAKIITLERARRLRRELSLPEVILWSMLRGGRLAGLRFRRQHAMGAYILDFYCPEARLGVEIDGEGHSHPDQIAHDRRRDDWLRTQGVTVMRVAADSVLDDIALAQVVEEIVAAAAPSTASRSPSPAPLRFAGEDP
jgi:very-short-patch-repair endonuclease